MKEFRKTLFAKTMYYIVHVISFVVFLASIIGEVALGFLGFYEMAPSTIYNRYLEDYIYLTEDRQYLWQTVNLAYQMRYWIYAITAASFILMVVFLVKLLASVGKRRGDDEIHTTLIDKIPTDIYLLIFVSLYGVCMAVADGISYYIEFSYKYIFEWTILALIFAAAVLMEPFVFTGLAIRVKSKTLFKNTICYYILRFLWKIVKWTFSPLVRFVKFLADVVMNIPLLWRTLTIVTGVSILELIVLANAYGEPDVLLPLWIIEKMILIPLVIWGSLTLRRLEMAGQKLADGDLTYKLDLKGLYWQFRRHGENLNSISAGMKNAVSKEIKSERMKTELISNVSHDIKTPLTSIINYATLISEEPCDNENIKEYSEVLLRQSDRLKRLTEDLVEASKASTGNIDVDLLPCDPTVFVTQADGEYAEKLEAASLTLVTKLPDEEVKIMADGRRMWRVFDNLMNNICKYALEGTRVYLSLDIIDGDAVFTFKNTSREMLDISEEELMERFVRGDKSRNTEGNGLGLSIARSMAEVQGGKLEILIDGDLFKATLSFPVVKE